MVTMGGFVNRPLGCSSKCPSGKYHLAFVKAIQYYHQQIVLTFGTLACLIVHLTIPPSLCVMPKKLVAILLLKSKVLKTNN